MSFKQPAKPERTPRAWPGVQSFAPMPRCDDVQAIQPKTIQHRNPHLLAMARGKPCLLCVPGVCNGDSTTTVAAHSNWAVHGKAKGRKANDFYVVNACSACHTWLDQGPATKGQKQAVFLSGHLQQVLDWKLTAGETSAPPKDRAAALWALERLNALPGVNPCAL